MKINEIYNTIQKIDYMQTGYFVDWNCSYVEKEHKIKLYFQGTNQKQDWNINLNFPCKLYKKQENEFWVHRGYKKAWKSTNDCIIAVINELISFYNCTEIEIYGHSYGGALAMIAAEDIYYHTGIKPVVITFGSPKIFCGKKSKNYIKSCCRIIRNYSHVNDIVPKIMFYYNVPNEIIIGNEEYKPFEKFKIKWHLCYGDSKYYE